MAPGSGIPVREGGEDVNSYLFASLAMMVDS